MAYHQVPDQSSSIVKSDKQIEIALKTNDIFSSQNSVDNEIMYPLVLNSSSKIKGTADGPQQPLSGHVTSGALESGNELDGGEMNMQAKIISYQVPKDFDLASGGNNALQGSQH